VTWERDLDLDFRFFRDGLVFLLRTLPLGGLRMLELVEEGFLELLGDFPDARVFPDSGLELGFELGFDDLLETGSDCGLVGMSSSDGGESSSAGLWDGGGGRDLGWLAADGIGATRLYSGIEDLRILGGFGGSLSSFASWSFPKLTFRASSFSPLILCFHILAF